MTWTERRLKEIAAGKSDIPLSALVVHWLENTGGTKNTVTGEYTGGATIERTRTLLGVPHFVGVGTHQIKLFEEVEVGDLIFDLAGDAVLPHEPSLWFSFCHVVRAATSEDVNPSGPATLDGVALATGDRVLLHSQTLESDNGIWRVNTAGDWTKDADVIWRKKLGVQIMEGDTMNGTTFRCVQAAPLIFALSQEVDTRRFQLKETGSQLAQAWDVRIGEINATRTLLLRVVPRA